jgi:hypothetical protein
LVLKFKGGAKEARTVEECSEKKDAILDLGKPIREASDLNDLMAKRMGSTLGLM